MGGFCWHEETGSSEAYLERSQLFSYKIPGIGKMPPRTTIMGGGEERDKEGNPHKISEYFFSLSLKTPILLGNAPASRD